MKLQKILILVLIFLNLNFLNSTQPDIKIEKEASEDNAHQEFLKNLIDATQELNANYLNFLKIEQKYKATKDQIIIVFAAKGSDHDEINLTLNKKLDPEDSSNCLNNLKISQKLKFGECLKINKNNFPTAKFTMSFELSVNNKIYEDSFEFEFEYGRTYFISKTHSSADILDGIELKTKSSIK